MERLVDSIVSTHAVGGASLGALLLGIRHMHALVLSQSTQLHKRRKGECIPVRISFCIKLTFFINIAVSASTEHGGFCGWSVVSGTRLVEFTIESSFQTPPTLPPYFSTPRKVHCLIHRVIQGSLCQFSCLHVLPLAYQLALAQYKRCTINFGQVIVVIWWLLSKKNITCLVAWRGWGWKQLIDLEWPGPWYFS